MVISVILPITPECHIFKTPPVKKPRLFPFKGNLGAFQLSRFLNCISLSQ